MRKLINRSGLKILSEHEGIARRCYVCKQRIPTKELSIAFEHQLSIHGTYIYIYEDVITEVKVEQDG
jgi:hypothetical protein